MNLKVKVWKLDSASYLRNSQRSGVLETASVRGCRDPMLGDRTPVTVNGLQCHTRDFELDSVITGDPAEWNPSVQD